MQAATVVKQKLEEDVERLQKLASTLPAGIAETSAVQADQTFDMSASDGATQPETTDIQAEIKSKKLQLEDVTRTLDENKAKVNNLSPNPM